MCNSGAPPHSLGGGWGCAGSAGLQEQNRRGCSTLATAAQRSSSGTSLQEPQESRTSSQLTSSTLSWAAWGGGAVAPHLGLHGHVEEALQEQAQAGQAAAQGEVVVRAAQLPVIPLILHARRGTSAARATSWHGRHQI